MLFSSKASILTTRGWEPIASIPYVLDIIGLDLEKETIEEIPAAGIASRIIRVPKYMKLFGDYIYTTTNYEAETEAKKILVAYTKTKPNSEFKDLTMDEAYLLGMILTDAYFSKTGEIEIYQSMKKGHVVEKIDGVLTILGIEGSLYERQRQGTHFTWRIKKNSAALVKSRFNLQDRGNPSLQYLFMPFDTRMHLLMAMMDGDGTWNNDTRDYGVFYKPQIIDFMQLLAMTLGYRTKTNSHRKQIYLSRVGLEGKYNWIEPDMTPVKQKMELVEIASDQLFAPIIMENEKLFFGKI
jgi:hypothetical protein